ncbi:hypothetical protein, partial [Chromobacterium haemolyticum]|uniref:hypothetical protein n=1 Tax=Chromobacterium haemolyticum TaxID=394935 RepID=UPI001964CF9F
RRRQYKWHDKEAQLSIRGFVSGSSCIESASRIMVLIAGAASWNRPPTKRHLAGTGHLHVRHRSGMQAEMVGALAHYLSQDGSIETASPFHFPPLPQ